MVHLLFAPSLLAAPHSSSEEIVRAVRLAEEGGADVLHIDVMDGVFVSEQTVWNDPKRIHELRSSLPLSVHLMIADPDERYASFVLPGVSLVSVHVEALRHPERTLQGLRSLGVRVGLALNPETPFEKVVPFLSLIDCVLVMSVHPGRSGQAFLPSMLEKVIALRKQASDDVLFAMDGGIREENVALVVEAGVRLVVVGSAVYGSVDPAGSLRSLRSLAEGFLTGKHSEEG